MQLAGHNVVWLGQATSTNAVARNLAAAGELAPGGVVIADSQSAGRGRRGRSWVTVPGRSLAASILLRSPPLARPSRLAVIAAVAACRALDRLGVHDVLIKWPNDLMRGERKIGGLLIEQAGPGLQVLGLGINLELRPGDLPPGLQAVAGDAGLRGDADTRHRLLAALLEELDAALADIGGDADRGRGEDYVRRAWLAGRLVELMADNRPIRSRVVGVTPEGDLLLEGGQLLSGETTQIVSVGPAR
jgi:BirA family biotin operon repressor/biotin-[acetyl-CoA-carboxylase] ligase